MNDAKRRKFISMASSVARIEISSFWSLAFAVAKSTAVAAFQRSVQIGDVLEPVYSVPSQSLHEAAPAPRMLRYISGAALFMSAGSATFHLASSWSNVSILLPTGCAMPMP